MVGEAEVGDSVGGRVGKLLAAADGSWRGGGAHGGRWRRWRRRGRARVWGVEGGGQEVVRNLNAQRARLARGRTMTV